MIISISLEEQDWMLILESLDAFYGNLSMDDERRGDPRDQGGVVLNVCFLQNAWSPVYCGRRWPRDSWLRALNQCRTG